MSWLIAVDATCPSGEMTEASVYYDKGLDEGFCSPSAQIKRRNGEQNKLLVQFYALNHTVKKKGSCLQLDPFT